MRVPVENIYYLLCYAWDLIEEGRLVDVGTEKFNERPVNLFAKVLNDGVARLISRGLNRDYLAVHGDVRGLKGRLDLATTVRRNLLLNGMTHCAFDELSYDVPQNRILKATLRGLTLVPGLDTDEKRRTERLYGKLNEVADVRLTASLLRTVQIHRNNRAYKFLLNVCRIIHQNLLVNEEEGTAQFHDFREDEQQMGLVFQKFVRAFCERETHYAVSAPRIDWFGAEARGADLGRLPGMHTDFVLRSDERTIIVDTKFYKEPLSTRFGERRRVRSANLYQIFAYVMNQAAAAPADEPDPEGWLLYAAAKGDFDFRFELMGRPVRACSIDLSQDWRKIERDLRILVNGGKWSRRGTLTPLEASVSPGSQVAEA